MCGGERVPARLQGEVGRGGLPLRPVFDGEATLTITVFSLSPPRPQLGDPARCRLVVDAVAYLSVGLSNAVTVNATATVMMRRGYS